MSLARTLRASAERKQRSVGSAVRLRTMSDTRCRSAQDRPKTGDAPFRLLKEGGGNLTVRVLAGIGSPLRFQEMVHRYFDYYGKLNEITVGEKFPIPNIEKILDQLGHSKYFTTLDSSIRFSSNPCEKGSPTQDVFLYSSRTLRIYPNAVWPKKCTLYFPKTNIEHRFNRIARFTVFRVP